METQVLYILKSPLKNFQMTLILAQNSGSHIHRSGLLLTLRMQGNMTKNLSCTNNIPVLLKILQLLQRSRKRLERQQVKKQIHIIQQGGFLIILLINLITASPHIWRSLQWESLNLYLWINMDMVTVVHRACILPHFAGQWESRRGRLGVCSFSRRERRDVETTSGHNFIFLITAGSL